MPRMIPASHQFRRAESTTDGIPGKPETLPMSSYPPALRACLITGYKISWNAGAIKHAGEACGKKRKGQYLAPVAPSRAASSRCIRNASGPSTTIE